MDTIVDQYQWDDRGTAFSTWRKLLQPNEEEWIAFKLCYVISSSIPVDTYEDHQTSIESRLDYYYPPWTNIIYIDSQYQPIKDERLLKILEKPYFIEEKPFKIDFNLGNRREVMFKLFDKIKFEEICFKIRNLSEDIIKNEEEYKMLLQKSLLKARIDIEERDKRLMQKMKNEPLNKDFDKDIELNKILNSY